LELAKAQVSAVDGVPPPSNFGLERAALVRAYSALLAAVHHEKAS
jgi:hypothetical protein